MSVIQESEPRKERFKTPAAVFMLFIQDNKVLLHRRQNTGWQDGNYDVPSGHVEPDEELCVSAARESKEETGLTVSPDNLKVVHFMHCQFDDYTYFQIYLRVREFQGTPQIMEPDKCDHLDWFDLNALPDNLVPYVRQAIEKVNEGELYSAYGWSK